MNKLAAIFFILLLSAFFLYFAGVPFVARPGFSSQSVSLLTGIALGVTSIVFARLWSVRRSGIRE
jgi:hypothetical protein